LAKQKITAFLWIALPFEQPEKKKLSIMQTTVAVQFFLFIIRFQHDQTTSGTDH
jgi:hypothetical protein